MAAFVGVREVRRAALVSAKISSRSLAFSEFRDSLAERREEFSADTSAIMEAQWSYTDFVTLWMSSCVRVGMADRFWREVWRGEEGATASAFTISSKSSIIEAPNRSWISRCLSSCARRSAFRDDTDEI
jgi:hypothetical protein